MAYEIQRTIQMIRLVELLIRLSVIWACGLFIAFSISAVNKLPPPPSQIMVDQHWKEIHDRDWSRRALKTVEECPHLEWLLLSKRMENALSLLTETFPKGIPPWIRVGTSLDDEKSLFRIDQLLEIDCSHFLSVEPLLSHLDLYPYLQPPIGGLHGIDQVIVGGESGPSAAPMNHEWVESIHSDCWRTGTPFFFKQNGEWAPIECIGDAQASAMCALGKVDRHEFNKGNIVFKVGKKVAGNRWKTSNGIARKTVNLPGEPMRLTNERCTCEACAAPLERKLL